MNVMTGLSAETRPTLAPGPARFSADEFWRMMASGAFEDMWVELIKGEMQRMPPPGRSHGRLQMAVIAGLLRLLPTVRVFGDIAIDLGEDSVIACDAAALANDAGNTPIVQAAEVALIIEIAVSTRERDLGLKRRLYAAAGIPVYWVIDAERGLTHVFDRPENGDYLGLSLARFGEPLAVPGTSGTLVIE